MDGKEMKVYVDGLEKSTRAIESSGIDYEPENDLAIGRYNDNNETHLFKGKIAEVRLLGVTRTQAEIQQDISRRLIGNEPGIEGY